jgi:hypothetical protein
MGRKEEVYQVSKYEQWERILPCSSERVSERLLDQRSHHIHSPSLYI